MISPVEKVVLEVLDDKIVPDDKVVLSDKVVLDGGAVPDDGAVLDDKVTVELDNGVVLLSADDDDRTEDIVLELVADVVEPVAELLALEVVDDDDDAGCAAQED